MNLSNLLKSKLLLLITSIAIFNINNAYSTIITADTLSGGMNNSTKIYIAGDIGAGFAFGQQPYAHSEQDITNRYSANAGAIIPLSNSFKLGTEAFVTYFGVEGNVTELVNYQYVTEEYISGISLFGGNIYGYIPANNKNDFFFYAGASYMEEQTSSSALFGSLYTTKRQYGAAFQGGFGFTRYISEFFALRSKLGATVLPFSKDYDWVLDFSVGAMITF